MIDRKNAYMAINQANEHRKTLGIGWDDEQVDNLVNEMLSWTKDNAKQKAIALVLRSIGECNKVQRRKTASIGRLIIY